MRSWTVAAPYPEGAVMQLAYSLRGSGRLNQLIMPDRGLRRAANPRDLYGSVRGRQRALDGLAFGRPPLREVAPWLEAVRLGARLGIAPGGRVDPMRAVRQPFDAAAARAFVGTDVLLGLPGASATTFERHSSSYRVLHQVDGHPEARNTLLREIFGARAQREILSRGFSERIAREASMADAILVPSNAVRDQFVTAGFDGHKIIRIPYGVDLKRFRPAGVGPRRPGPVRLLFVGQISYRKGIPFLLDAVRNEPVELQLVGPCVAPELLVKLPSNTRWRRTVANTSLQTLFEEVDAFVLPSVEDAFGLVVTEALAAGLPVITTRGTGASEVMRPTDGPVVDVADLGQLREAIRATEPLRSQDRVARAHDFRNRVGLGSVHDWKGFGDAVVEKIEYRERATFQ